MKIVFYHKNRAPYGDYTNMLKFAVRCAKKSNPDCDVVLISHADCLDDFVDEWVCLDDYFASAQEFEQLWAQFVNPRYTWQLSNVQRWFVINEWVRATKPGRLFCTDADVLIFGDLVEAGRSWEDCEFTLFNGHSAGISWINKPGAIELFCHKARLIHERPNAPWIVKRNVSGKLGPHSWGDMQIWRAMAKQMAQRGWNIGDTRLGPDFGVYLDHNITYNENGQYQMFEHKGVTMKKWEPGEDGRPSMFYEDGSRGIVTVKPVFCHFCGVKELVAPFAQRFGIDV